MSKELARKAYVEGFLFNVVYPNPFDQKRAEEAFEKWWATQVPGILSKLEHSTYNNMRKAIFGKLDCGCVNWCVGECL